MKQRFILFRRAGVFYCEETATGKQTSLRTKDEAEAITLLNTKNEATRQPAMNLQIAQVYLQHADPTLAQRTWQDVMDAMLPLKNRPDTSAVGISHEGQSLRSHPQPQIDGDGIRTLFAGVERRHDLHQHVFAPPPQFRGGDALASVAGPAEAEMARRGAQGAPGDHSRGTPENH
jgi:hypothetical protein